MSKMIAFFGCVILMVSCSTMKKLPVDQKPYDVVVDVPGKSANELYVLSNEWFVKTFNNAESVIQFQDKDAGKILGKYIGECSTTLYKYKFKSTITVEVKESKARISFSDALTEEINLAGTYTGRWVPINVESWMPKIYEEYDAMSSDFQASLTASSSDW